MANLNNNMKNNTDIDTSNRFHLYPFGRKFELLPTEVLHLWVDEEDHTESFDIYVEVHQIRALADIPEANVKKGDLGGHVSTGQELSNSVEDSSWIYPGAVAFEGTYISGDSKVSGNVQLYNCTIRNSKVSGNVQLYNCIVEEKSNISSTSGKIVSSGSKIIASELKSDRWVSIQRSTIDHSSIVAEHEVEMTSTVLKDSKVLSDDCRIVLNDGNYENAIITNNEDIISFCHRDPLHDRVDIYKDGRGHVMMYGPYIGFANRNDIANIRKEDVSPYIWAMIEEAKIKFGL